MLSPIDNYFLEQEEPHKTILLFLRNYILSFDSAMHETWQYGMPFFYYKDNRFCYLWVHKQLKQPYIGIVDGNKIEHPGLIQEKEQG